MKNKSLKTLLLTAAITFILLVIAAIFLAGQKKINYCINNDEDLAIPDIKLSDGQFTRFVAIGDIGEINSEQQKLGNSVAEYCQLVGCDFGLLLGDNFYENGTTSVDDPLFKKIFADVYNGSLKFFAVLGNHDVRGNPQSQIDYSEKNHNWIMPNYNYSFATEQAQFFGINSNCSVIPLFWYKRQAQQADKWQILFLHHSLYSTGSHGNSSAVDRNLWESASEFNFVLSGHNHLLEEILVGNTVHITSGAGSRPNLVEDERQNLDSLDLKFSYLKHGYTWVELGQDKAIIRFLDIDNQLLHEDVITKTGQ